MTNQIETTRRSRWGQSLKDIAPRLGKPLAITVIAVGSLAAGTSMAVDTFTTSPQEQAEDAEALARAARAGIEAAEANAAAAAAAGSKSGAVCPNTASLVNHASDAVRSSGFLVTSGIKRGEVWNPEMRGIYEPSVDFQTAVPGGTPDSAIVSFAVDLPRQFDRVVTVNYSAEPDSDSCVWKQDGMPVERE